MESAVLGYPEFQPPRTIPKKNYLLYNEQCYIKWRYILQTESPRCLKGDAMPDKASAHMNVYV